MGRTTRRDILLSSMTKETREAMYEIKDILDNLRNCSDVHIRLSDEIIIEVRPTRCDIEYCNEFVRLATIFMMILLCFTGIGIIIAALYYHNKKNFQHTALTLHYNKKNRDNITLLSRYFANYYNPPYYLRVVTIPEE